MTNIRARVNRLLKAAEGPVHIFFTEEGERISYTTGDYFAALKAALREKPHWLIDASRRTNTTSGTPGLLRALTSSRERLKDSESEE